MRARTTKPAAAAADSPVISWISLDLSAGSVYGNAAVVTARTETTITIDPGEAASAFLDNSPDNRGDWWWASQAVDLSDWPANSPALLMLEVIRSDSAPQHGTCLGAAFHNALDPTGAGAWTAVHVRRKITSGDGDIWMGNGWGSLGGYSSTWANRQRVTQSLLINSSRTKAQLWQIRCLKKDGDFGNVKTADLSASTTQPFDITGGLWVSTLCGAYQPDSPADTPAATTPIAVRYAVVPYGANPT